MTAQSIMILSLCGIASFRMLLHYHLIKISYIMLSYLLSCSYASTCQTVGMNLGYFTSFTVFLALNDADFCNRYFRPKADASREGILLLREYMRFWGLVYFVITVCVWLFKREDNFTTVGRFSGARLPGIALNPKT